MQSRSPPEYFSLLFQRLVLKDMVFLGRKEASGCYSIRFESHSDFDPEAAILGSKV